MTHGAPEEDQGLAIEFPALMGKLMQLLARPDMDTPDDVGSLGFGLLFAHTSLFCLLHSKLEAHHAGRNPPQNALRNVARGGFNRQIQDEKKFLRQ